MYHKMKFGKYSGYTLDHIPMEYLMWLFGVMSYKKKDRELYQELLKYFLDQDIYISEDDGEYNFNFLHHTYPEIDGTSRPWLQTHRVMRDSKGRRIFEVGNVRFPTFIVETNDSFEISEEFKVFRYPFGGETLVYERNPEYYFVDPSGKYFMESFLLRKPFIPSGMYDGKFTENLLTENL